MRRLGKLGSAGWEYPGPSLALWDNSTIAEGSEGGVSQLRLEGGETKFCSFTKDTFRGCLEVRDAGSRLCVKGPVWSPAFSWVRVAVSACNPSSQEARVRMSASLVNRSEFQDNQELHDEICVTN